MNRHSSKKPTLWVTRRHKFVKQQLQEKCRCRKFCKACSFIILVRQWLPNKCHCWRFWSFKMLWRFKECWLRWRIRRTAAVGTAKAFQGLASKIKADREKGEHKDIPIRYYVPRSWIKPTQNSHICRNRR